MTIEQEFRLQHLYEEHDQLLEQVKAIGGKYEALFQVLTYAQNKLALNEENIKRVHKNHPMLEDDVDQGELVEWLY